MAETDSILDNQEVTAQILNDIAIDLGHTSFNGFGEEKFGADELNGITSALVSSGILSSGSKCEPYILGDKVYIRTGIIVFSSGAKKKITETVELDLIPNSYIYALNDTAHNICKLLVSETAPTEDDFVNLCEIAADGTLTDKRVIAKAKIELTADGNSYFHKETITSENYLEWKNKTLTLPIDRVSKIFIYMEKCNAGGPTSVFQYDVVSQKFTGLCKSNFSDKGKQEIYELFVDASEVILAYNPSIGKEGLRLYIQVLEQTDEKVTFSFDCNNYWAYGTRTFDITFYVFGGVER